MNIGFDAKRAFHNNSGLGNYSRTLIDNLSSLYPENEYFLYNPKNKPSRFDSILKKTNIHVRYPIAFLARKISSLWRSFQVSKEIEKDKLNIFHGLSNELPFNVHKSSVKKVVTIHDLIFLRYPSLYGAIDRKIYKSKVKYSCRVADVVVAISEQTKRDLIEFLNVPSEKIKVVYQSCDDQFLQSVSEVEKNKVREKYGLPEKFILNVGTIEERKNLLGLIKAMNILKEQISQKLVVIGKSTSYKKKVLDYISKNALENKILFLENADFKDFPAIYQVADVFVYPSFFEGFGIPIIEALFCSTPVITSVDSCFSEAGGPYSSYMNPNNSVDIANEILRVIKDDEARQTMIIEGRKYALKFTKEETSKKLMEVYKGL